MSFYHLCRRKSNIKLISIFFYADCPDGKAFAGQESLEVKWFGFDEIPWDDYSFPSSKKSLSHFLKIKDQPQNTWVPRMETLDPVGR